jgi:hypothetical protein
MMYYAQGKYELILITTSSCYMDTMRNNLVVGAQKHKPDYILWIDADQLYPESTPEVLMKHIDSGKSVVGGLTPNDMKGGVNVWDIIHSKGIISPRKVVPDRGLIKVDAMGMGGVMMKPEILEKLDLPCFTMRWDSQIARYPGEDIQFYANCKKHGIDVWCDTSLVFGHIVTRAIVVEAPPEERK